MRLKFSLTGLLLPLLSFAQEKGKGLDEKIDEMFEPISDFFVELVLFTINFTADHKMPFVLVLLLGGALFFTFYFSFVNIKKFPISLGIISGKYDEIDKIAYADRPKGQGSEDSKFGEVSHFQALATAVSGTVGLGNIAGVALAISIGGPGATFWMVICGILGMSTKFVECTLGVSYRDIGKDGTVYGGPMYYLKKGFAEKKMPGIGKVLAVIFAILCIGASFGGGNAAQSNQAAMQIASMLGLSMGSSGTLIGIIIALIVGAVIIGGVKRIASVTEKVVPSMAILYIGACLVIIFSNITYLDDVIGLIFKGAFTAEAGVGGVLGVIITGFRRAAFSNEAGAGSSPIAHSAVKTNYAASEGLVALLEPFIDTVIICSMTAFVIIIYNSAGVFEYGSVEGNAVLIDGMKVEGAVLTSMAFASVIPWFPYVLTVAIVFFAISTMISWSYYGIQAWMFLFGRNKVSAMIYKVVFLVFIVIGAAASMQSVWDFSDAMILGLVFPNMIGLLFLYPKVKKELDRYLKKIKELGSQKSK